MKTKCECCKNDEIAGIITCPDGEIVDKMKQPTQVKFNQSILSHQNDYKPLGLKSITDALDSTLNELDLIKTQYSNRYHEISNLIQNIIGLFNYRIDKTMNVYNDFEFITKKETNYKCIIEVIRTKYSRRLLDIYVSNDGNYVIFRNYRFEITLVSDNEIIGFFTEYFACNDFKEIMEEMIRMSNPPII